MSSDDKYYVPVKVEDGCLSLIGDKMTEVLSQNLRLESIFQKYNRDYNTTFTERVSVKTLQVRNQNHKPIFSSITATGMIRSPFSSNVSAKKFAMEQNRRLLKRSRIRLSTERKRLSFDEPEEDGTALTHVSQKNCIDSQPLMTSPIKGNREPVVGVEEIKTASLDTSPTFLSHWGETEISYIPSMYKLEGFNPLGKPETVTSHSAYEQDNAYETPDNHPPSVNIPEDKSRTLSSYNVGRSRGPNLESSSIFCSKTVATASGSSNGHGNGILSLDETIGAIIRLELQETNTKCLSIKHFDKPQIMVTSCKKIKTPLKNTALDRSSVKSSVISPSRFSSEEQVTDSDQLNRSSQESFTPDEIPEVAPKESTEPKQDGEPKNNSSLSIEDKEAIEESYKTPDKCETMFRGVNRKERTPFNSIVVKTVGKAFSNEQEFLNPKEDNAPHNPKVSKRKSVDYSEETIMHTCLVSEDKKSVVPAKIAKLNDGLDDDKMIIDPAKYSTIADKDTLNPTEHSSLDKKIAFNLYNNSSMHKKFFNPVDGTAIDCMESFNPVNDTAMDDKESFNSVDDIAMDDKEFSDPIDDTALEDKEFSNPVDDTALEYKESFKPVDDSVMNDENSFYPVCESSRDDKESCNPDCDYPMHHKVSFNPVSDSSVDAKVSSNRADNKLDMDEMTHNTIDTHVSNFAGSAEKPERKVNVSTYYQMSGTLTYAYRLCPEGDPKITEGNISIPKKDQIGISSPHEAPDVQSSSNLVQNLSPSLKRTFDSRSQKLTTKRSDSDNVSFARHLCVRENLSETATPPRDYFSLNILSPKPESINLTKVDEFSKLVIQSKKRMFNYRDLFLEDKHDLQFICSYLNQITAIVEIISDSEYKTDLVETVDVLTNKAFKLLAKATLWKSEVERDLLICSDCYKNVTGIQQDLEQIGIDKSSDLNVKDFERWETCLRGANKKAGDAILLRDIRRPTILQFGYKIENVIQLFIQCLLVLGLIKPYSKVSFG